MNDNSRVPNSGEWIFFDFTVDVSEGKVETYKGIYNLLSDKYDSGYTWMPLDEVKIYSIYQKFE